MEKMDRNNRAAGCREIRALYDEQTITVYQAYSESIAYAAVKEQKLNASPNFSMSRMTWIKPSWCWMMYRSGYAAKDSGQTRVLALKMRHDHFQELLSYAIVTGHSKAPLTPDERAHPVRVQWDPERTPSLGVLPYRSIQIGISSGEGILQKWIEEWMLSIEDVTDKAKALKATIDDKKDIDTEQLVEMSLMPAERVYDVSTRLREILKMDLSPEG